jgi:hypothetical protein
MGGGGGAGQQGGSCYTTSSTCLQTSNAQAKSAVSVTAKRPCKKKVIHIVKLH